MQRNLIFVGVLGLVAASCVGCSESPDGAFPSSPSADSAPAAPEFSGPYATEYQQAWIESDSEFVRLVIEDEQISELEWSEVADRMGSCFGENGMNFLGFDADGGYEVDLLGAEPDTADSIATTCETESGETWIGFLRGQAISNPGNTDVQPLIYECLVAEGALPAGYSFDDYLRDLPTQDFPYVDPDSGPADFSECSTDPLEHAER